MDPSTRPTHSQTPPVGLPKVSGWANWWRNLPSKFNVKIERDEYLLRCTNDNASYKDHEKGEKHVTTKETK